MREWRKIRYWLDLYGCQVLQVKPSISLQGVSTILQKICQPRSHICQVLHQVGTFCSTRLHFHSNRRIPFSSGIIWGYKSKCWMWYTDTGQKFLSWWTCNIAYFAIIVFFFEIFCKTTCSTEDIYIYVHFKMLFKVLSWIPAFITPESSHHYYWARVGNYFCSEDTLRRSRYRRAARPYLLMEVGSKFRFIASALTFTY